MGEAARVFHRLAGRDHPRRHHTQAVQLRRDRRDRGRADHLNSRRARIGAQLGLSILLDARCLLRRAGAQPHRRDTHHGGFHLLHLERCGRPRPTGAAALWRRAHRYRSKNGRPRRLPAIAAMDRCGSAMRRSIRTSTMSMAASSWPRRRCSSTARLPRPGDAALFHTLEPFGEQAAKLALEPDSGIWEYRGRQRVHTHSAAMCWAGCQRLAAIANHLNLPERAAYWGGIAGSYRRAGAQTRMESETEGIFGGFRQR